MNTYKEFCKRVIDEIKYFVPKGVEVSLFNAQKNNGVIRTGITFQKTKEEPAPTIYLEDYYESLKEGNSIADLCKDIMMLYQEAMVPNVGHEVSLMRDYSNAKDKIVMVLVNYECNKEMLKELPHIVIDDLAVYYKILISNTEHGSASLTVRNEMLEAWKVTEEELYEKALYNTPRLMPPVLKPMMDMIQRKGENLLLADTVEIDNEEMMFVLTNTQNHYGAVMILNPEVIDKVNAILGGESYWILPSSTEELLLIKKSCGMDQSSLGETVREVNNTIVKKEQILSDHIYEVKYDMDKVLLKTVKESMADWKEK